MHSLPNLPASIAHEVFARLRSTLPEHPTDTPETLAARDDLAMAAVAALHPTDALDANVAVDIVLAEANYADSLRLAGEYRNDISTTLRCRARRPRCSGGCAACCATTNVCRRSATRRSPR